MHCRHCAEPLSLNFVDLGFSPPSNKYLTEHQLSSPETHFPLRVSVCERCWLVQTLDYTDFRDLFDDQYAYFSSASSTWLDHIKKYTAEIIRELALDEKSRVVEIASNDGYLLKNFVENQYLVSELSRPRAPLLSQEKTVSLLSKDFLRSS